MVFSRRLKEERKRIGYTQSELAVAAGITPKSQGVYESGKVSPSSEYLEKIFEQGIDVQYVITGIRSDVALKPDEREMLELYRKAPLSVKHAAYAALAAGVHGGNVVVGSVVHGNIAGGSLQISGSYNGDR